MKLIGKEHVRNPKFSALERWYIRLFGYPAHGLQVRAAAILPLIRSFDNPRSILDAGCGKAAISFAVARAFPTADILCLDTDQEQIETNRFVANAWNLGKCRFECMDVLSLSGSDRFDLILSVDNLEHVEDDRRPLALFYDTLNPGGTLLIHVPQESYVMFGQRRPTPLIEGHVRRGYSAGRLSSMLTDAGFEISVLKRTFNSFELALNNFSSMITGAREQRKHVYSLVYPFLLLGTALFSWWPVGNNGGGGLCIVARK